MTEELGLDHFEGQSWGSLHRHALMALIAFAFLQHQRLRQARRRKNLKRAATGPEPALYLSKPYRLPAGNQGATPVPVLHQSIS